MWTYNYSDELYHYGVKGMKWGVRKALVKGAKKAYSATKKHGHKVIEKQANRNDFRAKYHAERGHKLRSWYYDRQGYNIRDKHYDDVEVTRAAIKDLAIKSAAVAGAVRVGAPIVKSVIKNYSASSVKIGSPIIKDAARVGASIATEIIRGVASGKIPL